MKKDAIYLDSTELSKLYAATRKVDVDVAKHLRKRISTIAKPIVEEVRVAALSIPSHSGQTEGGNRGQLGLGLRQGIAAATESKIMPSRQGSFVVRIRVSGSKFKAKTGKYRTLPRYMEGLGRRAWRHPVWADKGAIAGSWTGPWTEQKKHEYLLPTVMKHKNEVKEEVVKAFIDALDELQIKL
jgi:hypothetical protein